MSTKSVLFAKRLCKKGIWLLNCPPLDFKLCVILIYRLKVSDMQVTFGFHTNCGGSVSMKSVNGDITNILLAPIIGLYFHTDSL